MSTESHFLPDNHYPIGAPISIGSIQMVSDAARFGISFFLLYSIFTRKSSSGISLQSQILCLIASLIRYFQSVFVDLSLPHIIILSLSICADIGVILLMNTKLWRKSYKKIDVIKWEYVMLASVFLASITDGQMSFGSLAVSTADWVESLVLIPQAAFVRLMPSFGILSKTFIVINAALHVIGSFEMVARGTSFNSGRSTMRILMIICKFSSFLLFFLAFRHIKAKKRIAGIV